MGRTKAEKAAADKERTLWYESRGLCNKCGREYATPGRKTCKTCRAKNRASWERHDPEHLRTTVNRKALRDARIAAGLCHACGAPAAPGRKMCERCLALRRDSTRKYKIIHRIDREAERARRAVTA